MPVVTSLHFLIGSTWRCQKEGPLPKQIATIALLFVLISFRPLHVVTKVDRASDFLHCVEILRKLWQAMSTDGRVFVVGNRLLVILAMVPSFLEMVRSLY